MYVIRTFACSLNRQRTTEQQTNTKWDRERESEREKIPFHAIRTNTNCVCTKRISIRTWWLFSVRRTVSATNKYVLFKAISIYISFSFVPFHLNICIFALFVSWNGRCRDVETESILWFVHHFYVGQCKWLLVGQQQRKHTRKRPHRPYHI